MKTEPYNKGKTKSPLGNAHAWIARTCETCNIEFKTQVKRISMGGGRYCGKRCNPKFAPKEHPETKYRRYNLKSKYGLTMSDYESMFNSQGGVCAICGEKPRGEGRFGRLVVDHNHSTGMIRKLLCSSCNRALGWFRDDTNLLSAAIDYINAHS